MRIGQIINAVPFKYKGAFNQSFLGKICDHLGFGIQFQHIVFEPGREYAIHRIIQISLSIVINKNTGVYPSHTIDGLIGRLIGSLGFFCHSHADSA
jgi:hypothetical protein